MDRPKIHQRERARILSDPATPDEKAEQILRASLESGEKDWMVWSAAVARACIPVHYFGALMQKMEFTVLISLAHSKRTPPDILEKLAELPVEQYGNLEDRWKEIRDIASLRIERRHR
jgi:hypothetical protein